MSAFRGILMGIVDSLTPDGTLVSNQARVTLDTIVTVGVAVLAIVLAVGYQVLGRWGSRFFGDPE